MSWEKFHRSHAAIKTSVSSKSEDREFLKEVKRLEEMDDKTRQLYKESKDVHDAEIGVLRAEQKLVTELCQSSQVFSDENLKSAVNKWSESLKQFEESVNQMTSNTQKVLVEPLKRLSTIFPTLQTAIKARNQRLIEYNKWHQKADKYQKRDRTGPNAVKQKEATDKLKVAKEEFCKYNSMLMEEIPKICGCRLQYLKPIIDALLRIQLDHLTRVNMNYTELLFSLDTTDHLSGMSNKQDSKTDKVDKFSEIRSLSIVASDKTM